MSLTLPLRVLMITRY